MLIFKKIIFTIISILSSGIFIAAIKAKLFTYGNGWDGIAGVLGGLMLGALIGLGGGIYGWIYFSEKQINKSIWILTLSTALIMLILYLTKKS